MMSRNDYKGWQIDPDVSGSADGWRRCHIRSMTTTPAAIKTPMMTGAIRRIAHRPMSTSSGGAFRGSVAPTLELSEPTGWSVGGTWQ
jgi:hypothetical protein